jgi:hypothetical protein
VLIVKFDAVKVSLLARMQADLTGGPFDGGKKGCLPLPPV